MATWLVSTSKQAVEKLVKCYCDDTWRVVA
jgi:hypothetical protein